MGIDGPQDRRERAEPGGDGDALGIADERAGTGAAQKQRGDLTDGAAYLIAVHDVAPGFKSYWYKSIVFMMLTRISP